MEAIIRFSVKRIIDHDSVSAWDKALFEATWFEYKLQVQNFEGFGQHASFGEFLRNVPAAETIHARVSPSVYPSLEQLGGKLPLVSDANGEPLDLQRFSFKILNTDFLNLRQHKIALDLISRPMLLVSEMASGFLTSDVENLDALRNGEEIDTLFVPKQIGLNVYSFQKQLA